MEFALNFLILTNIWDMQQGFNWLSLMKNWRVSLETKYIYHTDTNHDSIVVIITISIIIFIFVDFHYASYHMNCELLTGRSYIKFVLIGFSLILIFNYLRYKVRSNIGQVSSEYSVWQKCTFMWII